MWIQKKSKTRNRYYYFNEETKESIWEKPVTEYHIYHILIKHINSRNKINERTEEDAKSMCYQILEDLHASDDVFKSFMELANKFSDCRSKSSGGNLGYLVKNCFYAEFEKKAIELEKGNYSDIVGTPSGMHIIYRR